MKKAQMSMPFHWIYVMLAGGVILFFFIGIASRQKTASEEQLSVTLAQKLDSIFTGAAQTKQTFEAIELPSLDLYFFCDKDDASSYSVGNEGSLRPSPVQPLFAAQRIRVDPRLNVWSTSFRMPFQIINLLMLDAPTATTFLIYDVNDAQSGFLLEKIKSELPPQFNFVPITKEDFYTTELSKVSTPEVRLVFLTPIGLNGRDVPAAIESMVPANVHIVHVESERSVAYYNLEEGAAITNPLFDSVSIMPTLDDRNPALYAALFSGDAESYRCNMRKVFDRFILLAEMYHQRAVELKARYADAGTTLCAFQINPDKFVQLKDAAVLCRTEQSAACLSRTFTIAQDIQRHNDVVQQQCAVLY